ncbi:MAG: hypothetical protein AAF502_18060 [Bacteroidota bacterium]
MAAKNDLHALIHSLSKNERKNFRQFCNFQSGEKSYLKVFEALSSIETFDKLKLEEKLDGKVNLKALPEIQNYLYNLILNSLRQSNEKKSVDLRLIRYLTNVIILEKRGMHTHSLKVIRQGLKFAQRVHNYTFILEFLKRKSFILLAQGKKNLVQEIESLYNLCQTVIHEIEAEFDFRYLKHRTLVTYRKSKRNAVVREPEILEQIKCNERVGRGGRYMSFYSKYLDHDSQALIALIEGKLELANLHYKKILEVWDNHPDMKEFYQKEYIIRVSNYLSNCLEIKEFEDFEQQIQKIEQLKTRDIIQEAEVFQNVYYLRMLFFLNTGAFSKALSIVPEIQKGLENYGNNVTLSRRATFLHNIMVLFFMEKNFDKCLDWISMIFDNRTGIRTDIYEFARVLELIVHYELGHHEYVDNQINNLRRFVKQAERVNAVEKTTILYLQKRLSLTDKNELQTQQSVFLEKFQSMRVEIPKPLGIDELCSWVESHSL